MTLTNQNILLVDDDRICNFLSHRVLLNMGAKGEIHAVQNGQEALDVLEQKHDQSPRPDIIFLDLNMPVMDGFSFLEAYHHLEFPGKEKICIVVVSSSQHSDDIKRAMSLGADYYLVKPISPDRIRTALDHL